RVKSERSESAGRDFVPLDDEQAQLLSILAGRAGQLVTFDELRAAGIELPASLVAEIELAGVEIDRFNGVGADGRPVRGVRLPSRAKATAGLPQSGPKAADSPPRPAPTQNASLPPESTPYI